MSQFSLGATKNDAGVVVRACPDGPLLVRGADTVMDEDGSEHAVTRPVVAVCACGKSSRKPWCDSTHKSIR
ncbi:MAG: iron-sulfur protein [Marmoricola sp.]|nr:iron-sulfur protein [Marmoricola sp.]MCW2836988.1 iron-sulfur protein [Marmoricola sp.]